MNNWKTDGTFKAFAYLELVLITFLPVASMLNSQILLLLLSPGAVSIDSNWYSVDPDAF